MVLYSSWISLYSSFPFTLFSYFPSRTFPPFFLLEQIWNIILRNRGITTILAFCLIKPLRLTSRWFWKPVSIHIMNARKVQKRLYGSRTRLPRDAVGVGLISWRIFLRYTQQIPNLVSKVAGYNANGISPSHRKFLDSCGRNDHLEISLTENSCH